MATKPTRRKQNNKTTNLRMTRNSDGSQSYISPRLMGTYRANDPSAARTNAVVNAARPEQRSTVVTAIGRARAADYTGAARRSRGRINKPRGGR